MMTEDGGDARTRRPMILEPSCFSLGLSREESCWLAPTGLEGTIAARLVCEAVGVTPGETKTRLWMEPLGVLPGGVWPGVKWSGKLALDS